MKQAASIFNDVMGPIMTGPSSSHTAGPCRIGLIGHQLCLGIPKTIHISFDKYGSFAASYNLQGTDRGLVGGLFGVYPEDNRLLDILNEAKNKDVDVSFHITEFEADHPNTAKISLLTYNGEEIKLIGQSTGGGIFKIVDINGFSVQIMGDYYELIAIGKIGSEIKVLQLLQGVDLQVNYTSVLSDEIMLNVKFKEPLDKEIYNKIRNLHEIRWTRLLNPVLPVLAITNCEVPFLTNEDMMKWIEQTGSEYWEGAVYYESKRGGISKEDVFNKMEYIAQVMEESVYEGLNNPKPGRIINARSSRYLDDSQNKKLIPLGVMNTAIAWSMAVVEVNSRYGRIVAAPTGGACGVIPGAILGIAEHLSLSKEDKVRALLAAGIVGLFIAEHATFAAEICGCQAECGAASAMAAAGVVQLYGGTPKQCAAAASIALQNVLGMICDSVADLVEVPCLGRNVLGTVNAISCANMVMAGIEEVIPLDETIVSMLEVGKLMPSELCCTGKGGLAITKTSKCIKKELGY